MQRKPRIGSYRLHRASGQAVVTIAGQDHYLGRYGSIESRLEYDRLTAELSRARAVHHANQRTPADLTVAELCERYRDHAQRYYVKLGKPTSEIHTVHKMVKTIRTLYAHTLVADFGPLALDVPPAMDRGGNHQGRGEQAGPGYEDDVPLGRRE